MSNSRDEQDMPFARELLARKETGPGPHPPRSLDHLALALLVNAGAPLQDALAALTSLKRSFVDWNEIRVARIQELARGMGRHDWAEAAAKSIRDEYNQFFEKKGALEFDFLAQAKPAESRRALQQFLPKLGKGAMAILLYEHCPGATLPLSDEGLRQARRDGAVGKSGDRNQLSRTLQEALDPADAAVLVQYWEVEATGSPYGEPLKKDTGVKKGRKPKAAKK